MGRGCGLKRVAISQQADFLVQRGESRDSLDQRLVYFLQSAGFVAVPVPNLSTWLETSQIWDSQPLVEWLREIVPDALVLSGGQDIGKSPARDFTESSLLDYADFAGIPVLALCRGMQVMAHRAGTGLRPVAGHVRSRHELIGEIKGRVNSYHNYSLETCPRGFRILARSEDGEIEAIAHNSRSWQGWMWHPEREIPFSPADIERVRLLFGE